MNYKKLNWEKRKKRVRAKLFGTENRPRLSVFRSNYGLYAQLIDDDKRITLLSARTSKNNKDAAVELGTKIAKEALALKIKTIVFDRGGYKFHGVVEVFADTVRKGGVTF